VGSEPMTSSVQTTIRRPLVKQRSYDLLLRHCLAFEATQVPRIPARTRLEETLGPELTDRLISSLTAADRR